jgi:hypothetical protein
VANLLLKFAALVHLLDLQWREGFKMCATGMGGNKLVETICICYWKITGLKRKKKCCTR